MARKSNPKPKRVSCEAAEVIAAALNDVMDNTIYRADAGYLYWLGKWTREWHVSDDQAKAVNLVIDTLKNRAEKLESLMETWKEKGYV